MAQQIQAQALKPGITGSDPWVTWGWVSLGLQASPVGQHSGHMGWSHSSSRIRAPPEKRGLWLWLALIPHLHLWGARLGRPGRVSGHKGDEDHQPLSTSKAPRLEMGPRSQPRPANHFAITAYSYSQKVAVGARVREEGTPSQREHWGWTTACTPCPARLVPGPSGSLPTGSSLYPCMVPSTIWLSGISPCFSNVMLKHTNSGTGRGSGPSLGPI